MRILISNDDGVHAPGIEALERIARQLSDDVWIVAPAEEQSGAGHSLTISRPLRIFTHGDRHFSVSGTPTDAVFMAIEHLMRDTPPDLLLSGVNRGANLAEHITYSGTVAAAMEGTICGVRSIALSQAYAGESKATSFACAEHWAPRVIRQCLDAPWDGRMLLNINFPPLPAEGVSGIKVARQGFRDPGKRSIYEGRDPRGQDYYWLGLAHAGQATADSDIQAVRDGYVSVTPLHFDLTHEPSLDGLRSMFG